jgi:hypothetical protein
MNPACASIISFCDVLMAVVLEVVAQAARPHTNATVPMTLVSVSNFFICWFSLELDEPQNEEKQAEAYMGP